MSSDTSPKQTEENAQCGSVASALRSFRRKRANRPDVDTVTNFQKALRPRQLTSKVKALGMHGSARYSYSKSHSRRQILKRDPKPLSAPTAFIRLETRTFHKGLWLHVGDIVSLDDVEGGTYYAQLRGILIDRSEDVYVVLTWLVPTTEACGTTFDPTTYVIGMEEDIPRHIDCCSFVSRCPSDYFKPMSSPYTIQFWNDPAMSLSK
ncbi:hypothetical protein AAHC03_01643 [Spirometra sp. Aus1]